MRWGFLRALTFKEKIISDPEFRTEQRLRQSKIKPIYERVEVDILESSQGEVTTMDELKIKDSDSSWDDVKLTLVVVVSFYHNRYRFLELA